VHPEAGDGSRLSTASPGGGKRHLTRANDCQPLTAAIRNSWYVDMCSGSAAGFGCRCAGSLSLAVSGGCGEKSGCRADCGARAWRPCAPQPACRRVERWFCRRGLRRAAEAVTEPAGWRRFPVAPRDHEVGSHRPGILVTASKPSISSVNSALGPVPTSSGTGMRHLRSMKWP
jgi:hypothetical protein